MRSVYSECAIDVSSVRCWIFRFKSGDEGIDNSPHIGEPATVATMESKNKVDELVRDDRRITASKLWLQTFLREVGCRK